MSRSSATSPDTQATAHTNNKGGKRQRALLVLLTVVILAGLVWLMLYLFIWRWQQETDDAYVQGDIVSITSQTTGTVIAIHADDGMRVTAGQTLVQLDPNDTQVALAQAEAQLALTVRQVRGLFSSVNSAQADLTAREIVIQQARDDVERRRDLVAEGAVSSEELAHAMTQLKSAEAALASSHGQLARSRALVDATTVASQPQVQAAASQLRQAYLNHQRTAIVAPIDGFIAKRSVQLGQRIQAGQPLMAVIPLNDVWVDANFKETQLHNLRLGQPAKLTADVYGKQVAYTGTLTSLGLGTGGAFALLPPQNASGNWIKIVQRIPVRIRLDRDQLAAHPLRLGMSMSVIVDVHNQQGDVLPATPTSQPVLQTDAYAKVLHDADQHIERIIERNLSQAEQR